MTTLAQLAQEARSCFEFTGESDSRRNNIWVRKDDAPGWIEDMVRDAHGSMFPDDLAYEYVVDALDLFIDTLALSCGDDPDDDETIAREAIMEIEPDIYTHDLLTWLASSIYRLAAVDEAMEEVGFKSASDAISYAQAREKQDIAESVLDALLTELESRNDSEEEE